MNSYTKTSPPPLFHRRQTMVSPPYSLEGRLFTFRLFRMLPPVSFPLDSRTISQTCLTLGKYLTLLVLLITRETICQFVRIIIKRIRQQDTRQKSTLKVER